MSEARRSEERRKERMSDGDMSEERWRRGRG